MAQSVVKETKEVRELLPVPQDFFQLSERQDEQQIISELRGELIDTYVYRFPGHGGKEVVGLSYAGVREAIRRRGGVQIVEYRVEETADEFHALVKVRDHVNMIEMVGASACKKSQPFAYTLAYNKAERNAYRKLLPERWMAIVLREFQKRKQQRTLPGEPTHA